MKSFLKWMMPVSLLVTISSTLIAQDVAPAETVAAVAEAVEAVAEAAPAVVEVDAATTALFTANNVWMMVCTALVFLMHLGFATLECGLTRAKNTVNILFKNVAIVAIGLLTYFFCGFNLMYPGDAWMLSGVFGFAADGFGLASVATADVTAGYADAGYTYWTDFIFQGMFAATAATIISGAVAGRVKLGSFLIFCAIYVGFVYPVVGSWVWGAGWLDGKGFHDFAGSTLVHSVGGWGALICAIILGPRKGKFVGNDVRPIPGHSMPLATIGMFLLWLGWFGFNGGSVLSADPSDTSRVLVTTNLAAAAGVLGAMFVSWMIQKKPDLSMALNGALAGLVGITAGADCITPNMSIVVGLIAGVIVVFSVMAIDNLKIDDPVGAISVHLVCGIWGTIAAGLFDYTGSYSVGTQLLGIAAYGITCVIAAGILFGAIKAILGVRVSEEEEIQGLDIGEHGMEAYGGFQIFHNY